MGCRVSEDQGEVVKVDKASWPRTPEGTIDWESVFEDDENGLIPAISGAKKTELLIDCAVAVTEALFSRSSDESIRAGFTSKLASIAMSSSSEDIEVVLAKVISFLRLIKKDRIERANAWIEYCAKRNASTAPTEDVGEDHVNQLKEGSPERIFAGIFCDMLDASCQAIWGGVPQEPLDDKKIPFILSSEFTLRMQKVVRSEFLPTIIQKCRHIISAAQRANTDDKEQFLRLKMSEDEVRRELWDAWESTWDEVMIEAHMPSEPKIEKKGVLGSLVNAVKSMSDVDQEDPLETWKDEVEIVKMQQATVHEIWEYLTAPSPIFEVPLDADKPILKKMFARHPGLIRDQISALNQISEQSSSVGQAFDSYASGKDLQFALLSVSYQDPDTYLRDHMVLKAMLRGMRKNEREYALPLIVRYLGDYI